MNGCRVNNQEIAAEWIHQLSIATFDLGVDFPADSFSSDISAKVQARLLELYMIPKGWCQATASMFTSKSG